MRSPGHTFKSAAFLRNYFEMKKKSSPSFSLRGLAKRIKVDPSFLSLIFSGKKSIPKARFQQIIDGLGMDKPAETHLKHLIRNELLSKQAITVDELGKDQSNSRIAVDFSEYTPMRTQNFDILNTWYILPVLDLFTCKNSSSDPAHIADRLEISETQARAAVECLLNIGLLEEGPAGLKKSRAKIRFPASTSKESVRAYHREMIAKARQCLLSQTRPEEYQRRLITGSTVAVNPKNLERAKARLNDALHEIMEILLEGDCTEVYQLNLQLFPLTR
jgi:uncharacterized protein (TIGR02147 family)